MYGYEQDKEKKEKGDLDKTITPPVDKGKELSFKAEDVNPRYFYDESAIIKIWERFIQHKKLVYYVAQDKEEIGKEIVESLFAIGMSLNKHAGLLLLKNGKLYKRKDNNSQEKTISICESIHFASDIQGNFNPISSNIKVAFKQIIQWNKNKEDDAEQQITSHLIVFPYHPTRNHWCLGVLELNFTGVNLNNTAVRIYDPYGAGKISKEVAESIQQLQNELFEVNVKFEEESTDAHIKQQYDGSSCGVITAENGKDIIEGSFQRLRRSYPEGARETRLNHLTEIQDLTFKERQLSNIFYEAKGDKEIKNRSEIINNLLNFIKDLTKENIQEFNNYFLALANFSDIEKRKFIIQKFNQLRQKEQAGNLTEVDKEEIAKFCPERVYIKHYLEILLSQSDLGIIRGVKALLIQNRENLKKIIFEKTNLFDIFFDTNLNLKEGINDLLVSLAKEAVKLPNFNDLEDGGIKKPTYEDSQQRFVIILSYPIFLPLVGVLEIEEGLQCAIVHARQKSELQWFKEKLQAELIDEENGLRKYISSLTKKELNQLLKAKIEDKNINGQKKSCLTIPLELIKKIISGVEKYYKQTESKLKKMEEDKKYLASGMKKSLHGNVYQLKLIMLFVRRGLSKYSFTLATEMDLADKFDDIVFKYKENEKEPWTYRYLQAKHKLEENCKITVNDLLASEQAESNEFSLQKYFLSYHNIRRRFKEGVLRDVIICTNINFDFSEQHSEIINLKEALEEIKEEEEILNIRGKKKSIRYRFKKDFKGKQEHLIKALLGTSDLVRLAKELANHVVKEKKMILTDLFKIYHVALAKEVIDTKNNKFQKAFIDGDKKLSPGATKFREKFIAEINKIKPNKTKAEGGKVNLDKKEKTEWEKISDKKIKLSGNFGKKTADPELKDSLPGGDITEEEATKLEIDAFLEKLVFAVDQPNELELGEIISKEIGEELNLVQSDFIAHYFQNHMLNWMKVWKNKKSEFFATQDSNEFFKTVKEKVDNFLLIGNNEEYRIELKKCHYKFKSLDILSQFLGSTKQILNCVVRQDLYLYSANVHQTLEGMPTYMKSGSSLSMPLKSAVNIDSRLVNAFNGEVNLLILECNISNMDNETVPQLFEKLRKILIKNKAKKIVFITNKNCLLPSNMISDAMYQEIDDNGDIFSNLELSTQQEISQKTVTFQGVTICFDKLVPKVHTSKVLNPQTLSELVNIKTPCIGTEVASLANFERKCYRDRVVTRKININENCFKKNINDLFLISGVDLKSLSELIDENEKIIQFSLEKTSKEQSEANEKKMPRFFLLDGKNDLSDFETIRYRHQKKTIHLLRKGEKQGFVWHRSHGSLEGLREHVEETQTLIKADNLSERIIIIAAEPGMGKTILLTHLAGTEKQKEANYWVIKIELLNCKANLEEVNFNDKEDIIVFLSMTLKLNSLAQRILKLRLEEGGIKFFFDGYDEITSAHQTKIVNCIKILKNNTKVDKIVISTRLHMRQELEEALYTFSHSLVPFTSEDQKIFLQTLWKELLNFKQPTAEQQKKLDSYTDSLIGLFSKSIKDSPVEFMGIPLQARLLAEAFLPDIKRFFEGEDENLKLPETLHIDALYQRFIKTKYEIYLKEKIKITSQLKSNLHESKEISVLNIMHQMVAVSLLFANEMKLFFDEKDSFSIDELRRVGIVQSVGNENQFVHRTFAEYYVAMLLFELIRTPKGDSNNNKARIFLFKHIFKARNRVIFNFLNLLINNTNEKILIDDWKAICATDLLHIVGENNNKHKLSIVVYGKEELEKPKEEEEERVLDFDSLFDGLKKYTGRVGNIPHAMQHLDDFFDALDEVQDITKLENSLAMLSQIAKATSLERMKEKILSNITSVFEQYTKFILKKKDKVFQLKLILAFDNISSGSGLGQHGAAVASRVKLWKEELRDTLEKYKQIDKWLKTETKVTVEFLDQLTDAKILFLTLRTTQFTKAGIEYLKKAYVNPKKKFNIVNFKNLFLNIVSAEIDNVKRFLIVNKDFSFLLKFSQKHKDLTLTPNEVREIVDSLIKLFKDKRGGVDDPIKLLLNFCARFNNFVREEDITTIYEQADLLWLERDGISIVIQLKILNDKIANSFISILNENRINGYHTNYAANIMRNLIFPILDSLERQKMQLPGVNRFELINMTLKFVQFCLEHTLNISFDSNQFRILLKLIEMQANIKILSKERIVLIIAALISLSRATGCKLIANGKELTFLDPISEFQYKFSLIYSSLIIELILVKLKDEKNFETACAKASLRTFDASIDPETVSRLDVEISKAKVESLKEKFILFRYKTARSKQEHSFGFEGEELSKTIKTADRLSS